VQFRFSLLKSIWRWFSRGWVSISYHFRMDRLIPYHCDGCLRRMCWKGDDMYSDSGMDGEGVISTYCCLYDDCQTESVVIYQRYDGE